MAGEQENKAIDPQVVEAENRAANDIEPGAEDVAARQPEGADQSRPEGEEPEKRVPPVRPGKYADKRAEITAKHKEMRDERLQGELAEEIASTRERQFGRQVEQPALDNQPAAELEPQPGERPAAAKRKLKVNGQEIELTDEEVIAHAQRSVAAGDILDQAKRERATAEGILEALRATQAGKPTAGEPASEPAKPAPKTATKLSEADLAEIVDKIQVGDRTEALAALQKYGASVAEDAMERIVGNLDEKIAEQVHVISDGNERKRQTIATLESFASDNPEIRQSRPLQAALATQAADTMRSKLLAVGVREETLDNLQRENNVSEIDAIAYAYRTLQSKGHKLPSHAEILTEAADEMRKQGLMPAKPAKLASPPANSNFDPQQRVERKRVITQQPRRANISPNADAQQRSREDVQRAAVQQMRAHRRGRV